MISQLNDLMSRAESLVTQQITRRTQAELGVAAMQAGMLLTLATGHCSTAAEFAGAYGIDPSAVTRLLDRVESRGLLSRVRSSKDRCVVRLELTEAGHALARRIPDVFRTATDQVLIGFLPEEVGFLKSMLRRIHANCSGTAN